MKLELTEAEREALARGTNCITEPCTDCAEVFAAAESIVAARLSEQREAIATAIEDWAITWGTTNPGARRRHVKDERHPDIEVGSVWRRRKTGALVRIESIRWHGNYADISWATVAKPVRRGVSYQDYWLKNCEPEKPR